MNRRDEQLMARYLAAARGDVNVVRAAIHAGYRKQSSGPSPAMIMKEIKQLRKRK